MSLRGVSSTYVTVAALDPGARSPAWPAGGATLEVMPRDPIAGWTILDASFGGSGPRSGAAADRPLSGEIDVDAFISHRIGLNEVNRGSELMHHQDGSGTVVEFG